MLSYVERDLRKRIEGAQNIDSDLLIGAELLRRPGCKLPTPTGNSWNLCG